MNTQGLRVGLFQVYFMFVGTRLQQYLIVSMVKRGKYKQSFDRDFNFE